MDYRYERNLSMELGKELIHLNRIVSQQEMIIEELELKTAMYKSNFFHRFDLANRLSKQIDENSDANIGDFDGFCYCSWRANAVYRTLEDMCRCGLITSEEYSFCKELQEVD